MDDFKNGHYLRGNAIRKEYKDAFHEIGGMIEVLDLKGVELVPIMFAEATPGGPLTAGTYRCLMEEMMYLLQQQLPIDACLVVPHGAGVAEHYEDMDGHWLSALRSVVGDIPIVGTLDPHANVSEVMVKATDALIAYKTNPHVDQRETGKAAARLLLRILKKEIKPVQVLRQAQLAISIEQQNTAIQPCRALYELAGRIEKERNILSVSILLGFPYADVKDMGTAFIVVADNREETAEAALNLLNLRILQTKTDWVGEKKDIQAELPLIAHYQKPVLLLDMGDNIGGGAVGNSAYLLKALEHYKKYRSFVVIYDPAAVVRAKKCQLNEEFNLAFGNEEGIHGGAAYSSRVKLLQITKGKFKEKNPSHGGQQNYDMGDVAIVLTKAGNVVMLNSLRVPPFSLSQLTSFGIEPKDFDVVVAKGVNAPIAAYGPVCPTIIQINTPGDTQADMTMFHYKHRRRPLFPFEIN